LFVVSTQAAVWMISSSLLLSMTSPYQSGS
jgi:hypothetical protein